MRQDIREGVVWYITNNIEPNFTAMGRQFNCDYRTVKAAYLEAERRFEEPLPELKREKTSILDDYKRIIDEKLDIQCTAKSIYKFIKTKGFKGSYSTVKQYCRKQKVEKTQKATIRVEHTPGLAAQVDWKEDMTLISKHGEVVTFNLFLYVLSYSKKKFITLTFDRKQDTLFDCLNDAFYHTGGVPEEIWFDNMRTVLDHSKTQFTKVVFNQRFYHFSKDAGFHPIACRPYRPQTKGVVEALARTVDQLRVYNHEFDDTFELISLVNTFCADLNADISQATRQKPNDLWHDIEKEYLHEMPPQLLNSFFEDNITRIVSKEAMVLFRQCKYSVHPRYIGKTVEIELTYTKKDIHIYYNGEMIRSHLLSNQPLNYNTEDMFHILKSDVFAHRTDDDIRAYIVETLSDYDQLED